jgi:hypothetical protein
MLRKILYRLLVGIGHTVILFTNRELLNAKGIKHADF